MPRCDHCGSYYEGDGLMRVAVRRAAKEHACINGCVIPKGSQHVVVTMAPSHIDNTTGGWDTSRLCAEHGVQMGFATEMEESND